MKQQVEIEIPEGMELESVNPTFKTKALSYLDCVDRLKSKRAFLISRESNNRDVFVFNFKNEAHIEKLCAINKFLVVANALNDGWAPDWNDGTDKFYIVITRNRAGVCCVNSINFSICYFKTMKLAEQAIALLGQETIRLALGNY